LRFSQGTIVESKQVTATHFDSIEDSAQTGCILLIEKTNKRTYGFTLEHSTCMEAFIPFVILECAAAFVTGVGCRLASRWHRKTGWYIAVLGAVGVTTLAILWDDGGLLFHPSRWSQSKRSLDAYIVGFLFMTGVALIPSLFVVLHYRGKSGTAANNIV
jgi:hypothetical protein